MTAQGPWGLLTADPETILPTGGVIEGFPSGMCDTCWENELLEADFNKFSVLARSHDSVATLADVTDGELERSPRYRHIYRPMEWVDELRGAFRIGSSYWGSVLLVRDGSLGAFDPNEVQLVRDRVPQIARGLRDSVIRSSRITAQYPPAVLVLAADGSVEWLSDGAEAWVNDLATDGGAVGIPTVITIAAARARAGRATKEIAIQLCISAHTVRDHIKAIFAKVDVNSRGELVGKLFSQHLLEPMLANLAVVRS